MDHTMNGGSAVAFFCFSLRIQPFYPFQIVVLVEGEIEGRVSIASRASWYQLAIFESDFLKSNFKMLVGKPQTLSDLHRTDAGCAFLQNAFWCAVEARSHHGSMIITGFEVSQ